MATTDQLVAALAGAMSVCEILEKEYERRARWHGLHTVLVWVVGVFTALLIVLAICLVGWTLITFSQASAVENAVKLGGAAITAVGGFVTGKAVKWLIGERDAMEQDVNDILQRLTDNSCTATTVARPTVL